MDSRLGGPLSVTEEEEKDRWRPILGARMMWWYWWYSGEESAHKASQSCFHTFVSSTCTSSSRFLRFSLMWIWLGDYEVLFSYLDQSARMLWFLRQKCILCDFCNKNAHMGQFLQDGENEQNLAFFEQIETLLWLNRLIFSSFLNFSEEIMFLGV